MSHNGEIFVLFVCFGAGNPDFGDFFVDMIKKCEAQIRTLRKKLGRNIWAPKFFIEIENFGS